MKQQIAAERRVKTGDTMLRIHFTDQDLARTTVAATADPLWEVVLSVFRLRERDRPPAFRHWNHLVRHEQRWASIKAATGLLSLLVPAGPYFPDFLTPVEGLRGLEEGLEAIRRTPKHRVTSELRLLHAFSPLPNHLAPMARGDAHALNHLTAVLHDYHDTAIAPFAGLIQAGVEADRARRARDLMDGGVNGLLSGLRPLMRWHPPVLEVDYRTDRDLRLDGRGLTLVPSYFCRGQPVALADPELDPVLVYPIDPHDRWTHIPNPSRYRGLCALLGTTRAAILSAIHTGATNTQLAHRVGASAASISRHTAILREANLIASARHGSVVVHSLTPLGQALLHHADAP
ncbi:ArsR/SmtB family transcription factor [Actinosynnema sp. CA-248983]